MPMEKQRKRGQAASDSLPRTPNAKGRTPPTSEPLPHTSGTGQALGPSSGKVMPKAAALGSGLQVAWHLRGRTLPVRVSCRPPASTQGAFVLSGPEHSPGYARTLSVSQELSLKRVF